MRKMGWAGMAGRRSGGVCRGPDGSLWRSGRSRYKRHNCILCDADGVNVCGAMIYDF
jgi:hypothetical protein